MKVPSYQNLESMLLQEICDKICLHVPDKKSESSDVKEEPSSENSQENDREIDSDGSDSEASESEKDSGAEDDESETKYFRDEESDDAPVKSECLSDSDSWGEPRIFIKKLPR